MTDVRALLDEQARLHRRRNAIVQSVVCFAVLLTIVVAASSYAKGQRPDLMFTFMPLLIVGTAASYSPKHLQALRDAIVDPDPALDAHFAEALASDNAEGAKIGRQAFLERFADRTPVLDDAGWTAVAGALPKASTAEAEGLLRLIAAAAPVGAITPTEAFAERTKTARLQTLARSALGDLRLRVARERVLSSVANVERGQDEERERLGLTAS